MSFTIPPPLGECSAISRHASRRAPEWVADTLKSVSKSWMGGHESQINWSSCAIVSLLSNILVSRYSNLSGADGDRIRAAVSNLFNSQIHSNGFNFNAECSCQFAADLLWKGAGLQNLSERGCVEPETSRTVPIQK